ASLDLKRGDTLAVGGEQHRISGILSTGDAEDDEVVAPLAVAQRMLGRPGAVRRLYVSALTKPEDALARRDPKSMNPELFDRWYCSPYVQSIAYQLQETISHSHAEQIRQVEQTEGNVLARIKGLMKALGGANASIAALFFTEAAILAVLGGAAGYGAGLVLARQIGRAIFDSDISIQPVLFPIILVIAVVVTFAGSAAAIRKAVLFDPVFALRGEA